MIGDTLSDAVSNIQSEINTNYREEWNSLPPAIQHKIRAAIKQLDSVRIAVDSHQMKGF